MAIGFISSIQCISYLDLVRCKIQIQFIDIQMRYLVPHSGKWSANTDVLSLNLTIYVIMMKTASLQKMSKNNS